jgi:hypothetical protein
MLTRIFFISALIILLAGCATDPATQQKQALQQMEYKLQVYGPACEKLGFEKDTDGWRTCIQRENEQTILRQQSLRNMNNNWHPYYDPFFFRRW